MQRWWLIVAGIVGIGLAVLLIPRPDTGADVPQVNLDNVEVPPLPPIRQNETLPLQERHDEPQPTTTQLSSPQAPPNREPPTALMNPGLHEGGPLLNPKAQRLAMRRDTPEARYAARAMGPWTQIRRLLAIKQADDGQVQEVADMVDSLRQMFRDPSSVDPAQMEHQQTQLIGEIRKSDGGDPEIEKMLGLVEQRLDDYHTDQRKNAP